MDDVLLNKAAIIERCLRRVQEERAACPALDENTHLDALVLNLERACQAAIDMAMHVIALERLGVPQSTAQAFTILEREGMIDADLAQALRAMAGFRNVAVHQYQDLDREVVRRVAEQGGADMVRFCRALGVTIQVE